jgi:magnesium transporter
VPKDQTRTETRLERIKRLLRYPHARIRPLLGLLHPTEVAQVLEDTSPEVQEEIVRQLPKELISEALAEMDENHRPWQLLTALHPEVAASLIKELAPDDATDLLAEMPQEFKDRILFYIPDEEEEVINQLLTYDEESAGGLMNPEVAKVRSDLSKLEALREIVRLSEEMEEFYAIYVVDEEDKLSGYLTFKSLFQAKNYEIVRDIMQPDIISVNANMDQEEVAKVMSQYNLPTIPVVDEGGKLLGRITFDDILDVIEDETTEDILSFAGVSEDENLRGDWANAVKSRIPWLMINLVTAGVAAFVIFQFDDIIAQIVILTSFMPIIAGVAGNGATQTLAVTIRRISTDGIPPNKAFKVVGKEVLTGLINGLLIGAIISIAAVFVSSMLGGNPMIGAVVFLAMIGNLLLAGFVGSFIPIFLERVGIDPAVASSILITACTDIIGYTLLFSLAQALLL